MPFSNHSIIWSLRGVTMHIFNFTTERDTTPKSLFADGVIAEHKTVPKSRGGELEVSNRWRLLLETLTNDDLDLLVNDHS
jgi:hypothetical protein